MIVCISPYKVQGPELPSEAAKVRDFDAYAADAEDEGDWDFSNLTGGSDFGHCACSRFDYEHIREVCSNATILVLTSVFYLICMAVRSVLALSERPVVDTVVVVT